MDSDLKCNRLTCRRPLADKAVVTTCSHIFCIECANELFSKSRICPACETNLTEPDDVVVCSLQPTNDYKTSVLSGLTPSTILEICSRAISFWQYQIHQENAFQQAVVRNVNDKNGQLQKQLDNVIREANGEMNLLNNKKAELERDLELERRKVRELQETARERDKEYQKLKIQLDKIKRKTLFGPLNENSHASGQALFPPNQYLDKARSHAVNISSNNVDLTAVVGGMEANGIQRTPLVVRTGGATFMNNMNHPQQSNTDWTQSSHRPAPTGTHSKSSSHRPSYVNYTNPTGERSSRSGTTSRSTSANEVEHMLMNQQQLSRPSVPSGGGWRTTALQAPPPIQRNIFALQSNNIRPSGGFRPSIPR